MHFRCPLDGQILQANGTALRCPSGHSFDRAKEGYYNLLLVQQKASLDPGDSKEMVEARRRFLAAGYFDPIAAKLTGYAQSLAKETEKPRILDSGCGEGYYLAHLQQAMPEGDFAGIDISKWAIKAAAKSHKKIVWAVASNKQLPFGKNSLDLLLCVFGFPFWESFKSALVDGGYILLVDPAPEHLSELRELIYDKVNATDLSAIDGALAAGFVLDQEETVTYDIALESNAAILNLLSMTPHGYRITVEARERLTELKRLTTKVSVAFRLLRSKKP